MAWTSWRTKRESSKEAIKALEKAIFLEFDNLMKRYRNNIWVANESEEMVCIYRRELR